MKHQPARLYAPCLACLCLVVVAGCGGDGYSLATVEGRITDRGQPVAGASVTYQPIAPAKENPGPSSFGITDADGRYRLRTMTDNLPGAAVGRHRIRISMAARENQPDFSAMPSAKQVSPKFQDGSTVVEVPAGGLPSADFDFATPSP